MAWSARGSVGVVAGLFWFGVAAWAAAAEKPAVYDGVCDASAGVALDDGHFIMADNNTNALRIYSYSGGKPTQKPRDLSKFLDTEDDKEVDLEAAARVGDRIYWISSHGLNSDAERKDRRYRLFATDIPSSKGNYKLKTVGKPYAKLMDVALAADLYAQSGLAEAAARAPEKGGINVEGLAEGPDGSLYVGLRSPVGERGAMIIPLRNPENVVKGKPAELDPPIFLDLSDPATSEGPRGIRSLEKVGDFYVVIAGPSAKRGRFSLYRWDGRPDGKPVKIIDFPAAEDLKPEAIFATTEGDRLYLLSDDGDHIAGKNKGTKCEDLDPSVKHFRGFGIATPQ